MRFDKIIPRDALKPYIKYFVVSEQAEENTYKVFPSTGLVMGFQYQGVLTAIQQNISTPLASAGITGMTDGFKVFQNSAHTKTILVYFTETGWTHFSHCPAHELFNQSISLDCMFKKSLLNQIEEYLSLAHTDTERIEVLENFLLSQLKQQQTDKLIVGAIELIYLSKGTLKIKELQQTLCISASPFEKRFRKLVGTTPKKFASIVRFNAILENLSNVSSLTELGYEYHFFDQAHFIKDFKQYTGQTPEVFKLHR